MKNFSTLRKLALSACLGCLGCLGGLHLYASAQVSSVPFTEKGFLFSDAPTLTYVWPAQTAQFTLVFIPGGEGHLGLTPERKTLGGFYGATLKPLSDSTLTHGLFNVVVFDSPVILPAGTDYPTSRQSKEHLLRIESVVRYFLDRFGLPVWIMGHSNGAASMTEFYKMLQQNGNPQEIAGAIYSSARNGSTFSRETRLPVLFLAHEKDACPKSRPANSQLVYEELKKTNSQKVDYITLKLGQAQALSPCLSGFHMFNGAEAEAYQAIDQFALQFLPLPLPLPLLKAQE
jgi:pimeloyl-ACP methyl ester carboxylesterase